VGQGSLLDLGGLGSARGARGAGVGVSTHLGICKSLFEFWATFFAVLHSRQSSVSSELSLADRVPATECLNSEALFEAVRGLQLHVADPELGVKPRAAAAGLGGARGTGSSERRGGWGMGRGDQQRCSAKERSRRSTAGAEYAALMGDERIPS
jgi:hypothetical protein